MARKKKWSAFKGRSSFGSVFLRRGTWCYRIRRNGEQVVRAVGPDEQEARDALSVAQTRVIREKHLGVKAVGKCSFAAYRDSFRKRMERRRLRERNIAIVLRQFDAVAEYAGAKPLSEFRRKDIEGILGRLREDRGLRGPTVNRYLAMLSSAFKGAIEDGYAVENPCKGIVRSKEEPKPVPWVDKDDLTRIEAATPPEFRPLVIVAHETGMRLSELLRLEWRDVNLAHRVLLVRVSKTYRPREVPMTQRVAGLLGDMETRKEATPLKGADLVFPGLSGPDISRRFPRWCRAAGVQRLTFHGLRHAFASRMMRAGADLATLMKVGGWTSLATVQRYATHAPGSASRKAIDAMERGDLVPRKKKEAAE